MPRSAPAPERVIETKALRREAGHWLRGLREASGMTQADLAERVGLRYYTFVSQVENGLGRVPIELQHAWAEALGVEPSEFARELLRCYEPELFRLLFAPADARREQPGRARG